MRMLPFQTHLGSWEMTWRGAAHGTESRPKWKWVDQPPRMITVDAEKAVAQPGCGDRHTGKSVSCRGVQWPKVLTCGPGDVPRQTMGKALKAAINRDQEVGDLLSAFDPESSS